MAANGRILTPHFGKFLPSFSKKVIPVTEYAHMEVSNNILKKKQQCFCETLKVTLSHVSFTVFRS